jgi:uncharacterized RDD family membrane protein YckC
MSETGPAYSPQYTPPSGPSGPRANFVRRLLAALVDGIIVAGVFVIIVGVLAVITDEAGAVTVGYLLGLVLMVAYFTYFEGGAAGQTPGKMVFDIRVIDYNTGGSIGYPRALGRLFARYLSQLPCFLGFLWMLWDREKQTWHDKLVNCVVVPTDAYPVQ